MRPIVLALNSRRWICRRNVYDPIWQPCINPFFVWPPSFIMPFSEWTPFIKSHMTNRYLSINHPTKLIFGFHGNWKIWADRIHDSGDSSLDFLVSVTFAHLTESNRTSLRSGLTKVNIPPIATSTNAIDDISNQSDAIQFQNTMEDIKVSFLMAFTCSSYIGSPVTYMFIIEKCIQMAFIIYDI